jgi:TonB family protein
MRRQCLAASLAGALAFPAQAQPTVEWTATGKWNIEFADQQCIAARTFEDKGRKLTVALVPTPANDDARLWLMTADPKSRLERAAIATGCQRIKAPGMVLRGLSKTNERVFSVLLEPAEYVRLLSTGKLQLSGSVRANMTLSSLTAVRNLLDKCNADLLKQWGFGREVAQLSMPAKPHKDAIAYVQADDYPSAALRDGASGTAEVMVTVGVDGKARDCRVLQSAGHAALDSTTCAIVVRRARFEPARDASGKPVDAPFFTRISWRMH